MDPCWCIFLWLLCVVSYSSTNGNNNSDTKKQLTWITSDVLMPRYADGMAIGTYGDFIYLLGGINVEYQLIGYNMTGNKMVDFGANYLRPTAAISGYGQFYSVNNNIMYIIDGTIPLNKLLTFDLEMKTFTNNNWDSIPYNVGIGSCIVSTNDFLFILGGYNNRFTLNMLQILSIEKNSWMPNSPLMLQGRNYLTCNINIYSENHELYAIGGYFQNEQRLEYLNTVEYLIMTDPPNRDQQWKYMNNHLLYPTESARSVVYKTIYKTYILVIGGQFYDEHQQRNYLNIVQVIDTVTGDITHGDILATPIENTAAIIVNQIIYAFGGVSEDALPSDQWQYYQLIAPTNTPTKLPTNAPTKLSTNTPTKSPTNPPTKSPTNATTNSSTLFPTMIPTHHPTLHPMEKPTESPTDSSASMFISLTMITVLIGLIIYLVLYLKKRRNGWNWSVPRFGSKELLNSIQISSKHKNVSISKSNNCIDYVPMITIDENKELTDDEMHET